MADNLPLDIVQQILCRLTIKSIMWCSSICKAWYNIINTSAFASAHLHFTKSLPSRSTYLLIEELVEDDQNDKPFCVLYDDDESGQFQEYSRFKFQDEKAREWLVVGSCNGLICLHKMCDYSVTEDHADEIVIWNPTIERSFHLPKPATHFHETSDGRLISSSSEFGFVFDRTANDYIVLRFCRGVGEVPYIVEVFRLRTGLCEDISYKATFRKISLSSFQVDCKGIAHWRGVDNNDKYTIVTFDPCEEVFGNIDLPIVIANNDYDDDGRCCSKRYLFAFQGSLFMIRCLGDFNVYDLKFDIWKMGEYNVLESWNRVHTCNFHIGVEPLGFRKNGEILWVTQTLELISTNLADASTNYLGACPYRCLRTLCLDYEESLILLDSVQES